MVSSYCSAVTLGAAVKRARRLVLRASMTGAADGLVVAIDGLLRVDAPDRADLQPSASYRVAWRARILSQKALPNVSPISTTRALSSQQSGAHRMMHAHALAHRSRRGQQMMEPLWSGNHVRVRQRALQKASTSALSRSRR